MNPERVQCPKCARPMHRGFILELADQNRKSVASWVEGAPEQSFWT